jgi:hypothetical protein
MTQANNPQNRQKQRESGSQARGRVYPQEEHFFTTTANMLHSTTKENTMSVITFDTLQLVKDLQAKGFQPEQAEGISNALKDIMTGAEVATKQDINTLKLEIKAEIASIKAEIAPLKWMVGVTTAGIISLVIKTFF